MDLDQSAGLTRDVAKPSCADIALIDHVHFVTGHDCMLPDAVVVLNHVHGNIQPQHARCAQDERSHPDLTAHLRQAR